jgi:hypothetical protein
VLPRLFMLALAMIAAWYGRRFLESLMQPQPPEPGNRKAANTEPAAQDLVKCPTCGSYVTPHGPTGCGQSPCPYGG